MKHYLQDCVPFLSLMVSHVPEEHRPWWTRVSEQVIVGVAAAAIAIYTNDQLQTSDISRLQADVTTIKAEIQAMRNDLYVPRSTNRALDRK